MQLRLRRVLLIALIGILLWKLPDIYNALNKEHEWICFQRESSIEYFYDKNSIGKRLYPFNTYKVLIKAIGTQVEYVYDDNDYATRYKKVPVNNNYLICFDVKKYTYYYITTPYIKKDLKGTWEEKIYTNIVKRYID